MNVVGKAGYKETAIGWIPEDWESKRLSLLTRSYAGGTPNRSLAENFIGTIPWVKSGEVNSRKVVTTEECISESALTNSSAKLVEAGAILVAMYGATAGKIAQLKIEAATNQAVLSIRSTCPELFNEYLFWVLESQSEKLLSMCQGAAQPNLSKGLIDGLEIPLPPVSEQEKISSILTAVDDKLDVIARQIDATNTLKRGLMQTLFSQGVGTQDANGQWHPHTEFQQTELGEIPAGWTVQPLGALAAESRKRNAGELDDDKLCGVLKSDGLVPMRERVKGASTDRCRIVEPDAFAYNPMRINIGSIARNVQNQTVMVSPDYVVFSTKPQALSADFLDHFRRSDAWERFVGRSGDGGVRIRIYFDDLAQLKVATPPMSEQLKIAEVLDGINAKIAALTNKQTHYQTLKRGLMQKLLSGEWRVPSCKVGV
ncbi:restriction endonuclease subunit S [Chitinibacter tainanensis]|uniref:restriction endonuclease subunit S n=1 Tax=Chitinibacter tainanensis TaxID=230667 RepID=UPI000424DB27|nr:restriction endonuclease subunit S [Chitinibacter tainanensis]